MSEAVRDARQRQWRTAVSLAVADFRHEWRVSICLVLALAAVLGPLLALFGLKSGIVTTMRARLRADPVNREIVIQGHHALAPEWFAAMRARPDVGFVVPRTRWLSASMTLESPDGTVLPDVDMVPTAAGDPLVAGVARDPQVPGVRGDSLVPGTPKDVVPLAAQARVAPAAPKDAGAPAAPEERVALAAPSDAEAPTEAPVSGQEASPSTLGDVLLSYTVAQKLKVTAGARLDGIIARRADGGQQAVRVPLTVRGVLPETAFARDAIFVSSSLLTAAEDYRDGVAVPALGVREGEPSRGERRVFASARLYARELDDVAPLAEHLRDEGIEVVTRAREIDTVKRIDRVLSSIFFALATLGVAGCLASLATSLWANVDRKRREIALLRLVGLRSAPVVSFPVMQALLVAVGGIVVAGAAYAVLATVFNRTFASELAREEFVCKLEPADALAAAGLTLLLALVASVVGGYRALRIDPAESLRET